MENYNIFGKFEMIEKSGGRRKNRAVSSFLKKTYEIVDDSNNHYAVRWALNGIGFVIVKQQQFQKEILHKYFKHSNYSSFVRQLNMYNFHKIRQENHESHFHHQNFSKYNKNLLGEIHRKPEKKKRKDSNNNKNNQNQKEQILLKISSNSINNNNEHYILEQSQQVFEKKQKKNIQNTQHMCNSEKDSHKLRLKQQEKQRNGMNNLPLQEDDEDDKISINNELIGNYQPCPTKQIFFPSNNNIHGGTISQFNIFY